MALYTALSLMTLGPWAGALGTVLCCPDATPTTDARVLPIRTSQRAGTKPRSISDGDSSKVQLCPEFPMTSAEDNGRTAFASQINIPPLPAFLTLPHPRVLLVKELPDILSATNLCLRVCF